MATSQQKTALITGITGQDGSYLAEFLLEKGYIVQETQSDEIYNLDAQSHVAVSFESPEYTADVDGMGTLRILEAIRILGLEKKTRYFRPTEVETLLGDPSKAKQKPGWVPEITAQGMCAEMVAHDLAEAKKLALLKHHGYNVNVSLE